MKMSRHLSALQFKECPDYSKLQVWLSELLPTDATHALRPGGKRSLSAALAGATPDPMKYLQATTGLSGATVVWLSEPKSFVPAICLA